MEIKRAAELLRGLADGRDPITGARLPDESVYNHPEIIRALHCVLQELQTRQTGAQAVNAGRSWRPDEEQQLLEEYDAGLPVEQIARRHGRTAGAIEARLSSSAAATRSSSTCAEDPPMEAKQTKLELALQQELLQNAQQAAARYHSPVTRFVRDLQSRGSVAAVRDFVRRRAPSDAFASLEQAGHLELSPEATIIQARYGPLFTDEEINTCLTLLLEAGYF